jgi:hypothetical protein
MNIDMNHSFGIDPFFESSSTIQLGVGIVTNACGYAIKSK